MQFKAGLFLIFILVSKGYQGISPELFFAIKKRKNTVN
jgi:hypothetical protein